MDVRAELTADGILWEEGLYKIHAPQKCWVCQFARYVLTRGVKPDDTMVVHRKGVPTFLNRHVSHWAALTATESDNKSLTWKKWVPWAGIGEKDD